MRKPAFKWWELNCNVSKVEVRCQCLTNADCWTLKNGCKCTAILVNQNFRNYFQTLSADISGTVCRTVISKISLERYDPPLHGRMRILGALLVKITSRDKFSRAMMYVCEEDSGVLLSRSVLSDLGLIDSSFPSRGASMNSAASKSTCNCPERAATPPLPQVFVMFSNLIQDLYGVYSGIRSKT